MRGIKCNHSSNNLFLGYWIDTVCESPYVDVTRDGRSDSRVQAKVLAVVQLKNGPIITVPIDELVVTPSLLRKLGVLKWRIKRWIGK